MKKVTPKDYQSFIQIYKGLPERSAVKAPKTEFVEEIAALCMCSTKTVRMWIHGVQKPDVDILNKLTPIKLLKMPPL